MVHGNEPFPGAEACLTTTPTAPLTILRSIGRVTITERSRFVLIVSALISLKTSLSTERNELDAVSKFASRLVVNARADYVIVTCHVSLLR